MILYPLVPMGHFSTSALVWATEWSMAKVGFFQSHAKTPCKMLLQQNGPQLFLWCFCGNAQPLCTISARAVSRIASFHISRLPHLGAQQSTRNAFYHVKLESKFKDSSKCFMFCCEGERLIFRGKSLPRVRIPAVVFLEICPSHSFILGRQCSHCLGLCLISIYWVTSMCVVHRHNLGLLGSCSWLTSFYFTESFHVDFFCSSSSLSFSFPVLFAFLK